MRVTKERDSGRGPWIFKHSPTGHNPSPRIKVVFRAMSGVVVLCSFCVKGMACDDAETKRYCDTQQWTTQDGRTFEESADATPANVNAKVRVHYPRMALTRAKARALCAVKAA